MKKTKLYFSIFVIGALFLGYQLLARFSPDLWWFSSLGYSDLWWFFLKAKVITFCVFFGVSLAFLWLNLMAAKSFSMASDGESELRFKTPFRRLNDFLTQLATQRTQQTIGRQLLFRILGVLTVILALGLAFSASGWWLTYYHYLNAEVLGVVDPIYGRDLGFYLFHLPFYKDLQIWMSLALILNIGVVGWVYFSQNVLISIFSTAAWNKRIKCHLFILVALYMVSLSFNQWLNVYELMLTDGGIVFGLGYVDVVINQWLLKWTVLGYGVTAILFFVWSFRRGFLVPVMVGLLVFFSNIVLTAVLSSSVQTFIVAPNELEKEKPYIRKHIEFTRLAYGLDRIQEESFPVNRSLTRESIQDNQVVMDNVRLWNTQPLKDTFSQLQEIRSYYEFNDIDVDRYLLKGHLQQVMLSPRELNLGQLPSAAQNWINQRLTYTHGYGLCMTPVNRVTPEGLPEFLVKDFPPVSTMGTDVDRPEIYYGEMTEHYVISNTHQKEFDFPKGDTNQYTYYQGKGGIQLRSFWRRLAYSIRFSDLNILISGQIHSQSRIMYNRDVLQRVNQIMPYLSFDQDPYLVLSKEGRLVWFLDGFTTSRYFPYSQPYSRNGNNYVRNSVKVTVDAYSGEVQFYVSDSEDYIIQNLAKIFKNVFHPLSDMPVDLQAHIRYPKSLFWIQASMYRTYHMTDIQVFYNKEDVWDVPFETYHSKEQQMMPYYMVTTLPGDFRESFLLMLPFTPANKQNMISWLTAKCDGDDYGRLKVFKFPKERTIYGPMQIESRVDQDTDISQKLTLWDQAGSQVIRGNLMVIPINDSLIYVEPVYLQSTQSKMPELKRVIFSYADEIVMAQNLELAVQKVFGDADEWDDPQPKTSQKDGFPVQLGSMKDLRRIYKRMKSSLAEFRLDRFGVLFTELGQLIEPTKDVK